MSRLKSNLIKYDDREANMYGCQPCPKCKSRYRVPYMEDGKVVIKCDECRHQEDADEINSEQ